MLKMYINDEEVVSNKDFTISEELLVASSTVLNNCYPKIWENDKNYVSRFYYPKDYSKCRIYNYYEGDIEILGSTTQDGTPSPNNPVPIINKTGVITENVGGKNFTIDLGDIELCKIESYQDKIYYNRNNNKWYLHKEIDKIAIKGNDNITHYNGRYWLGFAKPSNSIMYGLGNFNTYKLWLERAYYSQNRNDIYSYQTSLAQYAMGIMCDSTDTASDLKEKIDNSLMYYPLANFVETEITDEALLSQLNGLLQKLLFVGIVKNSADISLKPTEPKYCSLQILDFKTLLSEGDLLDFVISNKTIEQAIEIVIEKIANYGFVKGNIQILGADNIIGAYSTLDKTPYDVFQYLAEISQSIWFTRTIDENTTAIDFYDPTLMPRKENLQYDAEYWENNGIKNVSFAYGTYDYRNKQVVLSDEVFSDIDTSDIIIADGYSKQFDTLNKIAKLNYIKVGGVEKTFATNEDKELGVDANFYYSPGSTTVESNENEPVYSAGSIIEINYIALVKGRQIVNNQDEIGRITGQLNRNGVISRYETRNDVLSSEELNKIAQTYIRYKGTAEIILTVETFNNDLYNIGDVVFFEAPIEDLQLEYLVKKKSINIINTGNYRSIFYTYELSSSFNGENAINWFDNQRAKATGNLESGDYITRNIDNEATANIIFKNLNIVEVQVEGDNVLNAPLNSPLVK